MIKYPRPRSAAISLGLIRRQRHRIADLERRLAEAWSLLNSQPSEYLPEASVFIELAWILAREDLRPQFGRPPRDAA